MSERRFVLLDRDGTVLVEKHYLADPEGVELIDGAAQALRRLAELGLGLVVVTNQSALARGMLDLEGLERIHRRMRSLLASAGAPELDGLYFCPHHPDDACACRKPRTGLVERAASELGFDPARSLVVGDAQSDIELGQALGATSILVRTGHGAETEARGACRPDFTVDDLAAAAQLIEQRLAAQSTAAVGEDGARHG